MLVGPAPTLATLGRSPSTDTSESHIGGEEEGEAGEDEDPDNDRREVGAGRCGVRRTVLLHRLLVSRLGSSVTIVSVRLVRRGHGGQGQAPTHCHISEHLD